MTIAPPIETEPSEPVTAVLEPLLVMSAAPAAETAECCCPDFCERDHDNE